MRCLAGRSIAALLVLGIGLGVSSEAAHAESDRRLRVVAAASLTEVVEALAARFEAARVATVFGPSGTLARQLRDGAPGDVFLSASPEWMDFLADAEVLAGDPVVLARNRLVCITSRASALAQHDVRDAIALLERLDRGTRVAIADRGVPAGEYARDALRASAALDAYRPLLVGQRDVRAVLHAVERGEVEAGFVYATDARIAPVEILFELAADSHPAIEYQAAVLRAAASPDDARHFLDHLRSPDSRALLAEAGFALP